MSLRSPVSLGDTAGLLQSNDAPRRHGSGWLLVRSGHALSLLLGVIALSFGLFNIAPGDTARTILGPNATEEAVARLRTDLGTDRPVITQFGSHVRALTRFDMGRSAIDRRLVAPEVAQKFLVTGRLALLSSILSLFLSYLVNFVAYVGKGQLWLGLSRIGAVMPTYCAGVLAALVFGLLIPVVPLSGYGSVGGSWRVLLLPAAVAAMYPVAAMSGILDTGIRRTRSEGFVRTAEAYGFSPAAIFHKTLLPALCVPWLAAWVNHLSVVFVAGFVLEVIFSIPGTGVLLIQAIQQKDFPMLQGILLVNASFFIVLAWSSDLAFRLLDPRGGHVT